GRRVDGLRQPLRWYAVLEIGVAATALASLALPTKLIPLYQTIFEWADGRREWLTLGQAAIALALLLAPTALMGATLPMLSADGARRIGSFSGHAATLYAVNTFGAVVGVMASGFVLIELAGETRTLLVGAGLNVVAAVGALILGGPREPSGSIIE